MTAFFRPMNEAYIEKHYPKRSVFESVAKATKKLGIGIFIFFGLVLAGSLGGLAWSIDAVNTYKLSGDSDMVDTGKVISIVFAVVALISVLTIVITILRRRKGAGDWLKKSAENSKLSEMDIQEFERQALAADSYILKLLDGVNAVMSGGKDGILTNDFIYLADLNLTVIRCKDLVSACLVKSVFYIGSQQQRRPVNYLSVYLLSRNGVEAFAEVSPEAGEALLALLLEKYPTINTNEGRVLTEKEYDSFKKTIMA